MKKYEKTLNMIEGKKYKLIQGFTNPENVGLVVFKKNNDMFSECGKVWSGYFDCRFNLMDSYVEIIY